MVFPTARNPEPSKVTLSPDHAAHRCDRLVGPVVAVVEGRADRLELRLEVAGSDAEDDPPAAQHVEGRDALRHEEWIPVGDDQQVGVQPDGPSRRGGHREHHQRIE